MDSNFSEAIKIIRKKAKNDKDLGDVFEKKSYLNIFQ